MAIRFACPNCGKTFELPESAAGKKARCKKCTTVFEIPRPANERRPAVESRVYDLGDDEDDFGGPTLESGRRGGSLEEGTRVGMLGIEEWSPERLTVSVGTTRLLLYVIGGAAAFLLGMVLLGLGEHALQNARGPVRLSLYVVFIPFALMGLGVYWICSGARLGTRMTFDRASRSLSIRRFLIWDTTWIAEDLDRLVFLVMKPTNASHPNSPQPCEAYVVDRDGRAVILLERVGSFNSKGYEPLASTCLHAGALLGLPVAVDERAEPRTTELQRAIELLRGADRRRRAGRAPTFRKPMLTSYRVGGVLASVIMIGGLGWFILKWSKVAQDITDAVASAVPAAQPARNAPPAVVDRGKPAGRPRIVVQKQPAEPRRDGGVDRLLDDLKSGDQQKRQVALMQLEHRDPGPRRDELRQAVAASLDASDSQERQKAVKVLGRWGTDEDLARLVGLLDEADRGVRNAAAEALARRKYVAGAEAMAQRLHHRDDRFSMAIQLRQFGPAAAPFVAKLLDDPDDDVKLEAAKILESVGTKDQVDALRAAYDRYKALSEPPPGGFSPRDGAATAQFHFAHRILGPLERAIRNSSNRTPQS